MKNFRLKWEFVFNDNIYGDSVIFNHEPTMEEIRDASEVLLVQAQETFNELSKIYE